MSTEKHAVLLLTPAGFDHAFRMQLSQALQVAAAAAVNRHPATAGDETGDGVRRCRSAALGQLRQQLVHADDEDAAALGIRLALARQQGFRRRPGRRCAAQRSLQLLRPEFLAPGGGKHVLAPGVAELLRQVVQIGAGHAFALQFALHHGASLGHGLGQRLRVEPLPHLVARARTLEVTQRRVHPVAARPARFLAAIISTRWPLASL